MSCTFAVSSYVYFRGRKSPIRAYLTTSLGVNPVEFGNEPDSKNWRLPAKPLWSNRNPRFGHFDAVPECDGQTNRHLDRNCYSASHML